MDTLQMWAIFVLFLCFAVAFLKGRFVWAILFLTAAILIANTLAPAPVITRTPEGGGSVTAWFLLALLFLVACVQTLRVWNWQHKAGKQSARVDEYGNALQRLRGQYFDARKEVERLNTVIAGYVRTEVRLHVKANTRGTR